MMKVFFVLVSKDFQTWCRSYTDLDKAQAYVDWLNQNRSPVVAKIFEGTEVSNGFSEK